MKKKAVKGSLPPWLANAAANKLKKKGHPVPVKGKKKPPFPPQAPMMGKGMPPAMQAAIAKRMAAAKK